MRKFLFSLFGLLLLSAAVYGAYWLISNKKKPKEYVSDAVKKVVVQSVTNTAVPIKIKANGNLVAKRRIELYAEVQGIFRRSNHTFKPGVAFKKGDLLLGIDASEQSSAVLARKSELFNLVSATMPDIRLDFPDAAAKWQAWLSNFDINKGIASLPKIDSEQENYFINGRNIISVWYQVKNLEDRLAKYYIRAPFEGVLTEALVNVGSLVRNGQKLGTFIDPSIFEMEVVVNKEYGVFLKSGQEVLLTNLEETFSTKAKIVRVNSSVNSRDQTLSAWAEAAHPQLKEGMFLEAWLQAHTVLEATEISRRLLVNENQIFAVKDSLLYLQKVKPVYFSEQDVVVQEIPDGTLILTHQLPGAYTGMKVAVANKE